MKSFDFSAFGFAAGVARDSGSQAGLTPALTSQLFETLAIPLREVGIVVAIDRLDDSWDGSEEAKSLMIGLLKAAKEMNDRLRNLEDESYGLRLLVFLRSDVYDSLRFDDKDKHRPTERSITWTPELLASMVNARMPEGVSVDDLFEPGEMRGSITPFNYIVKRTFLRPREVLQFLDECLSVAGMDNTEISKDSVREAEERYSGWKVDDLRQEFIKVFPDFGRLLECLRQGTHRYDTLTELEAILEQKDPELVREHGSRSLLETLFDYSVIGVRLGDAGSTRYKAESPNLTLPVSGAAYVHQSLYKGLAIREKRANYYDAVEF